MPQFSDDIYLGNWPNAYAPNMEGATSDPGPSKMAMGVGPLGRVYIWDVVPLTLQTAGLATSQNPGSGASFTLTAGTGVTAVVDPFGVTRYVLDVPRCVTITAAGANSAAYRVTGYDVYGQPMTANISAPSTSTTASTKAFKSIISITNSNSTAGTNGLTCGFNDKLGLPVRASSVLYVVNVKWDAALAQDAGTFVAADTTSPATSSTTDVRGCYTPSTAANGTRRLVMAIALPALAVGPNSTRVGAFGVTQA
jgi:hypothetical protein